MHELAGYGLPEIEHAIHGAAVAGTVPAVAGAAEWVVTATGSGVVRLVVGAVLIPAVQFVVAPVLKTVRSRRNVGRAA